ncbi:MAG: class I SAM-dependent methyltransferase [Sphingobacteriaceae bacterium]|nr:class I SAM-dependent methyltransferase [Cytophagaceae bacterium]
MHQSPTARQHQPILEASRQIGFSMNVDELTGSLLRTLARSKPAGRFLELGTGTGLSTAWILEGMDADSSLISIENDSACVAVARQFLGNDARLDLRCEDADAWLKSNQKSFDFIFADTWAGKYRLLDEALAFLKKGGVYVVDDLLPQPNWPEGHHLKAKALLRDLTQRVDLQVTALEWSTGILIATKL